MLGRGDSGRSMLAKIASRLSKDLPQQMPLMKGVVLKQTAAELKTLGDGLEAMLGVTHGNEDSIEKTKVLFPILRKLISQSAYWREEDRKITVAKAALTAFGPEVESVTQKIRDESLDAWPTTAILVGRVRAWEEALPAGNKRGQKLLSHIVREVVSLLCKLESP